MRTIDYIQYWTTSLEEAGFDVETTTEEILSDLAFVAVDAVHECGENFHFRVAVHGGKIDHNRTSFMIAHRTVPYGTGRIWNTYKKRGEANSAFYHSVRNAKRLAALATEEV